MESLEVLEKLLTRHRLAAQKENDAISSEWLTVRCDAMCLKIKYVLFVCMAKGFNQLSLFMR